MDKYCDTVIQIEKIDGYSIVPYKVYDPEEGRDWGFRDEDIVCYESDIQGTENAKTLLDELIM